VDDRSFRKIRQLKARENKMRHAIILTINVTMIMLTASGCKFGSSPTNEIKSDTTAATTIVHGMKVPVAKKNEILIAMNGSPGSSSGGATDSTTMIAQSGTSQGNATQSGLALAGDPYIERCRSAGVPIPPPWGDREWKFVRTLQSGRIFALDPTLTTSLYSFQDKNVAGTCAALPRMNGGTIEALGIICQARSGQACFWDNKERTVQTDSQGRPWQATISRAADIRPETIANGDNLVENCSSCHRGSNVFILHHEDLQALPGSNADDPYVPVSTQPQWVNATLDSASIPQCATCHDNSTRLGKLDPDYCNTVMMKSIQSMKWEWIEATREWKWMDIHDGKKPPMPPDGEDPATYARDIAFIKAQCKKAIEAANGQWLWDQ
jgi:hypothetical protein